MISDDVCILKRAMQLISWMGSPALQLAGEPFTIIDQVDLSFQNALSYIGCKGQPSVQQFLEECTRNITGYFVNFRSDFLEGLKKTELSFSNIQFIT